MTNVYDKAHELARTLKDCNEAVQFRETAKKVEKDASNKKMLDDFRKIQFEAYTEQMQTGKISDETQEKLQKLGSVISLNPVIAEYLQVEARFGVMWEDIMRILNEAIGIE